MMTGFSCPEMLRAVVDACHAGETGRIYDIFDAFLPIVRLEMSLTTGLAVRKYTLHRRVVLPDPKIPAPGPALSDQDRETVDRLLARLERRLDEIEVPFSLRQMRR